MSQYCTKVAIDAQLTSMDIFWNDFVHAGNDVNIVETCSDETIKVKLKCNTDKVRRRNDWHVI